VRTNARRGASVPAFTPRTILLTIKEQAPRPQRGKQEPTGSDTKWHYWKDLSNIPVGQTALVYYFHNMRLLKHGLPGILSRNPRSDLPGSRQQGAACSQNGEIVA